MQNLGGTSKQLTSQETIIGVILDALKRRRRRRRRRRMWLKKRDPISFAVVWQTLFWLPFFPGQFPGGSKSKSSHWQRFIFKPDQNKGN